MIQQPLPRLSSRKTIAERLPVIFPEGIPYRNYCTRELAASTVFVMLYIGAVEGSGVYLGPKHVYKMTDEQSQKTKDEDRRRYDVEINKRNIDIAGKRWYADNTREPIRDETLRQGLVYLGVVNELKDMATTSSKPRYSLHKNFAALFNPELTGVELEEAISNWQEAHLSVNAQARIRILKGTANADNSKIRVIFPNGETRFLEQGPSSHIAKEVIEVFAIKFLERPFVLWLSESGNKVVKRDDDLANDLKISIDASRHLPDIILVDVSREKVLFVFVEVVATDGAMSDNRKEAFYEITDKGGYNRAQVLFVTAYRDRQSAGFKKTIGEVPWGSFIWFSSEPDNLLILEERAIKLTVMLNL